MQPNPTKNENIEFVNYEMSVNVCGVQTKVFLQRGFFNSNRPMKKTPSPYSFPTPHLHRYPEIHLFIGEGIKLTIEKKTLSPAPGTILIIPELTYHSLSIPENSLHCAFQLDIPIAEAGYRTLPIDLLHEFISEMNRCSSLADFSKLERYISFIASYFVAPAPQKAKQCTDYAFIILEFMSLYYNLDIHLSDLAERLHVSEKQTARLVVKYTGNTFNDELTRYRISAAKQLMAVQPDLPVSTVASLVGYQSHSGFRKAYKRYHNGSCPRRPDTSDQSHRSLQEGPEGL